MEKLLVSLEVLGPSAGTGLLGCYIEDGLEKAILTLSEISSNAEDLLRIFLGQRQYCQVSLCSDILIREPSTRKHNQLAYALISEKIVAEELLRDQ